MDICSSSNSRVNSLDLETYSRLYSGRAKVLRLIFIADHCDNEETSLKALKLAYEEIKKGVSSDLFKQVVDKIDGRLGNEYLMDQNWIADVDGKADLKKATLENELKAAMTNYATDVIRMIYNDLGDFFHSQGHLDDAFRSYVCAGDYCTTPQQILPTCLNAILVSIEMGEFSQVAAFVTKAQQTLEALDPLVIAKLQCASGLAYLNDNEYKLAANQFLESGPELGNHYTEVVASEDVASYGGLCALASFSKTELKTKVIDNVIVGTFLERVPELKELLNSFYSSRYDSSLKHLANFKGTASADIHLHDHVEALYSQIERKGDLFNKNYQIQSASLKVTECQSLCRYYQNALNAFPQMQKSSLLKHQLEQTQSELDETEAMIMEKNYSKRKGKGYSRRELQSKKSALATAVSKLDGEIRTLAKYTQHGIEGKSESELEALKSKAESNLRDAEHACLTLQKEYFQRRQDGKFGASVLTARGAALEEGKEES